MTSKLIRDGSPSVNLTVPHSSPRLCSCGVPRTGTEAIRGRSSPSTHDDPRGYTQTREKVVPRFLNNQRGATVGYGREGGARCPSFVLPVRTVGSSGRRSRKGLRTPKTRGGTEYVPVSQTLVDREKRSDCETRPRPLRGPRDGGPTGPSNEGPVPSVVTTSVTVLLVVPTRVSAPGPTRYAGDRRVWFVS